MPVRKARAYWEGTLPKGNGSVAVESGTFEAPYDFATRFESSDAGTNPEELIGAAHAGCYSMALSKLLADDGHPPDRIQTSAEVTIDKVGDGFEITSIGLATKAKVPGITQGDFERLAEQAKKGCPVSKALTGTNIKLTEAKLEH